MPPILQSGALPFRLHHQQLEVLLITSRRTGKWGIPKGHLEDDMTPSASALMEAYEEAGIQGTIGDTIIGSYVYTKRNHTFSVDVYPLQVTELLHEWPEQHQRQRQWFTIEQAIAHTTHLPLQHLFDALQDTYEPHPTQ